MKILLDTLKDQCYSIHEFTKTEHMEGVIKLCERKMYDYSKLSGRIREKCGTQETFARRIKRSHAYVSNTLNNKAFFSQNDIANSVEVLEIPAAEIGAYFFTQKVHNKGTK